MAFTVKTYGRMDTLVNGAAGNFLANAHELKLKVGSALFGTTHLTFRENPVYNFLAAFNITSNQGASNHSACLNYPISHRALRRSWRSTPWGCST